MSPIIEGGRTYLTPEELVGRWRGVVSARTLDNWRSLGRGPIWTQVHRRILYALADVERWECERRKGTTRPEEG